jgi:hypothetical protein
MSSSKAAPFAFAVQSDKKLCATIMSEQQQYPEETTTLLPTHTNDNEPKRKDWKYYLIWFWRFCIFGITGSSSVHVTRMVLRSLACPCNVYAFRYSWKDINLLLLR